MASFWIDIPLWVHSSGGSRNLERGLQKYGEVCAQKNFWHATPTFWSRDYVQRARNFIMKVNVSKV